MTNSNQNQHWIETTWFLKDKQDVDMFLPLLEQFGSLGSYEKMGIDDEEEALRKTAEVLSYFPDQENTELLQKKLQSLTKPGIELSKIERIPQADWATNWKKYFKPFTLTKNIVIKPSWEEYTPNEQDLVITLDPGMAFGTGQHDTTKYCAELLVELKEKQPNLKSLYDIGCGSGILSIIAKKIGFKNVFGTDIDPDSVENSYENLDRNPDCKPIDFKITKGNLLDLNLKPTEVVVSNIIAEALCDLKDNLVSLVQPGGYLILSGIIPDREEMIKESFKDLELVDEKKSGEWNAYLYCKK